MQSVERVAGVLLCFTSGEPELGVTDIAKRLDLPKSAVHRVLEALTKSGLTAKEHERGRYRLGPRATELSLATLGTVDVRALAQPVMEALRDSSGETVTLSFLIGAMRVYVAQAESRQDVRMTIEVGKRVPLYAGASGRAMLMTFSETELEQYLDEVDLTPLTKHTVRDRDTLREVLAADRERGYAESHGERDPYAAAVAAPILGRGPKAFACFSVCGPRTRLAASAQEVHGPSVVAAAATVSELIRGS